MLHSLKFEVHVQLSSHVWRRLHGEVVTMPSLHSGGPVFKSHSNHYFPVVLFIMLYKEVLTFESMDEILKCDHSLTMCCLQDL